ncbi:uncharacterized protein LOC134949468 [Pseudophryne corroboree]|uniref:uncharacterized protein LOC134949468 n=1 Tax=Pseudophryne corroboree TaxID=495146 RepID=UPI003081DCF5
MYGGYSESRTVSSCVTELEDPNQKNTCGLANGKRQGETISMQCDMQDDHEAQECNSLNIRLSNVCSQSKSCLMLWGQQQPEDFIVNESPMSLEDYKLLNTLEAEGASANLDFISICPNESSEVTEPCIPDPVAEPPSLDADSKQMSPNKLSPGHLEHQSYLPDQLPELKPQFPFNINGFGNNHDTTWCPEGKGPAVMHHIDCSEEDIDVLIDKESVLNPDILIQQIHNEYESLFRRDKTVHVFHEALNSNWQLNDQKEEMTQSYAPDKKFCCILGWTAYVSGKQLQCSCTPTTETRAPTRKPGLRQIKKPVRYQSKN